MTPTPPDDLFQVSPRFLRYLIAILVVVAGVCCGAVIPGTLGGTICTALVGIGLVGVISMVFYDVGLTEDRDRERQRRRRARLAQDPPTGPRDDRDFHQGGRRPSHDGSPAQNPSDGSGRPRPPQRLRGQRRRLR
jgi:hypothetical protein